MASADDCMAEEPHDAPASPPKSARMIAAERELAELRKWREDTIDRPRQEERERMRRRKPGSRSGPRPAPPLPSPGSGAQQAPRPVPSPGSARQGPGTPRALLAEHTFHSEQQMAKPPHRPPSEAGTPRSAPEAREAARRRYGTGLAGGGRTG